MAGQINKMALGAKEFTLNFTLAGVTTTDLNFEQIVIPGKADADTEDVKLNHSRKKVVVNPGVYNDFQFTTKVCPDFMAWHEAADNLATFSAYISGDAGGAFAGDVIEISGKMLGLDDTTIGTDGTPDLVFKGTTEYFKYTSH